MITRISKIAQLPKSIRDELNTRLHNGHFGRDILPWLNNLSETKEILAENFEGKPVTHQNLSEWRRAGYQDWLLHQQRIDWFEHFPENDEELKQYDGCSDTYEAMSRYFVFEIGQAMKALQQIKDPAERWARLETLNREFCRLQNSYNWSRRVAIDWDKYNGPEPEEPVEPPITPKPTIETAPPTLGAPCRPLGPSRPPVPIAPSEPETPALALQDAPRTSEPEDQRASVLECGSPLPLSDVNPSTLNPINSQPPTPFHPIPTPAPTTTQPADPPIRSLYTRTRGRGFTCIEG